MRSILILFTLAVAVAQAQFGPPITLPVQVAGVSVSLEVHDVNGDGIADLVLPHPTQGLVWHAGVDGQGAFLPAQPVLESENAIAFWALADLSGDGRPEVVAKTDDGAQLVWSLNDGTGAFAAPQLLLDLVAPELVDIGSIALEDFTGDGLRDIAVTASTYALGAQVRLAVNDGSGFGAFVAIDPSVSGPAPIFMNAGDIDMGGGNDLITKDWNQNLFVLRNVNGDGTAWVKDTVLTGFWEFDLTRPQLLDVDGDGDLDLAEAAFPDVLWIENRLQEGGVMLPWVTHQLAAWTTAGSGAFGHLGCGPGAGYVVDPMNPSEAPRFAHWLEPLEAFSFPNLSPDLATLGPATVLADINGDGRDDILSWVDAEWILMMNLLEDPLEEVLFPTLPALCKWGMEVDLPEAQPAGGQWSGPAVFNNQLLRTTLPGSGFTSLGYSAYAQGGCAVAATTSILVVEQPLVSPFVGGEYCQTDPPIQMVATPPEVAWVGVAPDGIFDPGSFQGSVVLAVYTDPTGTQCAAESLPILIQWPVPVSIDAAGPFCINSGQQLITGNTSQPDYFWSGDIASWNSAGAIFLPSQGAGTYTIVLNANPGTPTQCMGSDTLLLVVNDQFPNVLVSELPILCSSSDPIDLQPYGTPTGGVWAGPGVSGNSFIPQSVAAGDYMLTYTAEQGGCLAGQATAVKVMSEAQIVPDAGGALCAYDASVPYTAFPAGGSWGAPWSANGTFDPAAVGAGSYSLSYTWTGTDGCVLQNAPLEIEVLATTSVSIDAVGVLCDNGPQVLVTGLPGGTWSGAGQGEGESVVVDPAALGAGNWPLTLTATLPGQCAGSATELLIVEICTGTEQQAWLGDSAWPNPFSEAVVLAFGQRPVLAVELTDAAGRLQAAWGPQGAMSQLSISAGELSAGAYVLRVLREGQAPVILRLHKL